MAIRMVFIGRTIRILNSKKDKKRRKNVGCRFNGIRDQRIGIPKKAREAFYDRQDDIPSNAEICCFYSDLFVCDVIAHKF
jgi:hypothetical protein